MSHAATVENPVVSFTYRGVWASWERLRLVYNLILLGLTVATAISYPAFEGTFTSRSFLYYFLLRAVEANVLFCAGPILDMAISWAGYRSKVVTAILFGLGLVLSMLLTYVAVNYYAMNIND